MKAGWSNLRKTFRGKLGRQLLVYPRGRRAHTTIHFFVCFLHNWTTCAIDCSASCIRIFISIPSDPRLSFFSPQLTHDLSQYLFARRSRTVAATVFLFFLIPSSSLSVAIAQFIHRPFHGEPMNSPLYIHRKQYNASLTNLDSMHKIILRMCAANVLSIQKSLEFVRNFFSVNYFDNTRFSVRRNNS